jgi:isoleucyl-tRNA synthetase
MIDKYVPTETEKEILKFWEKNEIYKKAKEKNEGKKSFYFLDGPPYTSGKIHLGIAWNKSLKDSVLRYKRMAGFDVWDRAGYDMHGLPTAHKVMDKLEMRHKEDIPKYGVDKFIKECKKLSLGNLEMMNKDFDRLGVWMDFKNPYKSVDNSFMEGEWWLIKKAFENERLYEGEKTMHWCSGCATSLAKHELEYKNVKDNSIFVKFKVKGKKDEYLIIWTTTPWTLSFNLAVMVHPELDYVRVKVGKEIWVLAKGLSNAFLSGVVDTKFEIIEEFKGEELKGVKYVHPWLKDIKPFSEIESKKLHSVVLCAEYVDLSAGSGLVHTAPGCGPEDYEVGHREGLPPFNNLKEDGTFPDDMGQFSGLRAKKDDEKFIEALEDSLIATTPVEHEYAHCWRCRKPVIFRTTKQWFFKVEDMKEDMRKLNKKIEWVPDWAGNNWFDSWLNNLRDNGITRQRYWGTPLPIWRCECGEFDVIGSAKELKKLAGEIPKDLHRPWIDEVKYKCSCGKEKVRIPDILDVWIDSGVASWTCLDYPQKEEMFKKLWPADFILEGKDQIRGWFNLLFVASMVGLEKPSYKSVYMHGFIQDSSGRKMSKSLGNIISPYEVIDEYGSDTLRYYMIGGANAGLDINYNPEDLKVKYKYLFVIWNLHKYLIDLCSTYKIDPVSLKAGKLGVEEEFIFSKLNNTIKNVTSLFDKYKIDEVPLLIEELFLALSRTYIQSVRDKLSGDGRDVVVYTLYNVLMEGLKLFAPIVPFITETVYLNLKEEFKLEEESVHMFDWPSADEKKIDDKLEEYVDVSQSIIQVMLSGREKMQLGVRWPIKEAIFVTEDNNIVSAVKRLEDNIKTKTNVKKIVVQNSAGGKGDFEMVEYKSCKIYINKERNDELDAEGYAREVMRRVQVLRKKAGLQKKDEIKLAIKVDDKLSGMLSGWSDAIKDKVGAKSIEVGSEVKGEYKESSKEKVKGKEFELFFEVV